MDYGHAMLPSGHAGAFLGIEMVLSGFAREDLAILGDLEALRI